MITELENLCAESQGVPAKVGLNLEHFFEMSQVASAVASNEGDFFEAHATVLAVVKARLNRYHMPGLQRANRVLAEARSFVNFQSQAMARAVEKSFHPAIVLLRAKALFFE